MNLRQHAGQRQCRPRRGRCAYGVSEHVFDCRNTAVQDHPAGHRVIAARQAEPTILFGEYFR